MYTIYKISEETRHSGTGLFGQISRTPVVERIRGNPRDVRVTFLLPPPHNTRVVFSGDPRVTSLRPHQGTLSSLVAFRLSVGHISSSNLQFFDSSTIWQGKIIGSSRSDVSLTLSQVTREENQDLPWLQWVELSTVVLKFLELTTLSTT